MPKAEYSAVAHLLAILLILRMLARPGLRSVVVLPRHQKLPDSFFRFSVCKKKKCQSIITRQAPLLPPSRTYPSLLAISIRPVAEIPISTRSLVHCQPLSGQRTGNNRCTWTCRHCFCIGTCSFAAPPPGTDRKTRSWIS